MKLLDSDLLGILLALLTFILPAVSGVLEKKRKERKRREAEMYQHAQPEYPQQPQEEELQEEQPKLVGEVDELFNILMGKETAKEEEILPDSFQEHQPQDELQQEMLQQEQLTRQLLQQEPETREPDPVDEEIPVSMGQMVEEQVESQTEQMGAMEEPEPESGNKFKKLIKANPKEAVVLSEILTPKFKEYN